MESLHAAMRLITPGCFWSRYLKDAYYTVNVSEEFRNYLRFIWRALLKMISYNIAIPYEILYTKYLEQDKTSALKYNKGNFDSQMNLSAEFLNDLDW
ncbi:LOW QUALITY PROTEIN: hypothetical protein MAR_025915 [Mya arenaria]|uniref:Uncharacterized protein n=1 Tax=Mya arenaria TaxID=6604 RepID=A0ABY7EP18_MYAAR|nr:LOW QUALITY PROTEIN: hypothetical protein MAR_025915 [Mya arenaria]